MNDGWRPLSTNERAILERLLSLPFEGRDELRSRVDHCLARPWSGCEDHCGSLELLVTSGLHMSHRSPVDALVPVEGRTTAEDGSPVDALLFHQDGRLRHLEFVVYGERIGRQPRAGEITIQLVGHFEADEPPA